jgi:hypothetical protein
MSKDTSALDSEKLLENWKALVTKRRGEYSQRLKLARLTSESESSSWPTATTRDWKDTGDMSQSMIRKDGKERMDTLGRVVQVNNNMHGSRPESWATPEGMAGGKTSRGGKRKNELLLTGQVKAWASPHANCHTGAGQAPEKQGAPNLQTQVQSWATPSSSMTAGRSEQMNCRAGREGYGHVGNQLLRQTGNIGKLNPRWVCVLMNLPVFWVKP